MPRISEQSKERQMELVWLRVKQSPQGTSEADIAGSTGIHQRTVNNYLRALGDEGKVEKIGKLWFLGNYQEIRSLKLELSPEEAYTYYLGSRLFVKQHDKRNRLAETALLKLADALAANKLVGQEIAQAARELAQRPGDPTYETVFQTMVRGYLNRKRVAITYKPLNGRAFDTVFESYLMEPSAIGYATYVIGYSSLPNALRAYKLERIIAAHPLPEEYRIPDDFPGLEILRNSWSIIMGEETVKVVLRFSPQVKERVRETQWHPSQQDDHDATKTNDHWLTWWVQVAGTIDMLPWIRSWGADCEVIGPVKVRQTIVKEVQKLVTLYQAAQLPTSPRYQQLWAKTSQDRTQTHPLICHLLDVAQVALSLWNNVLTDSARTHFADTLGLTAVEAGRTIAFWVGLHDLGKACPGFQRLHPPAIEQLTTAGLTFPQLLIKERCYHATITTCTLDSLLVEETGLSRRLAKRIAQALGGHHGTWPPSSDVEAVKQNQIGDANWHQLRRELVCILRDLLHPASITQLGQTRVHENTFLMLFSGLTTTADWIGSMEEFFPYVDTPIDPATYFTETGEQALNALAQLHWIGWQPPQTPVSFETLFPFAPNVVQQEAIKLVPQLDNPALVIIEVTTGAGKTETALYLADHQAATRQQRGMYIAMPTMATSNQMFSRTSVFLQKRYPSLPVLPLLVHSQARWLQADPPPEIVVTEETSDASLRDMSWFLPRKRSLLAPFGVGTVDQTLLSVLQTRHFFVRLFALSHKTIIFDEVHAYDVYMSELFQQLLRWLHRVGATVIILSATLPALTRRRLVAAYLGTADTDIPAAPYPAITWATANRNGVIALTATEARPPIALQWIDRDPQTIVNELTQQLRDGGCAAVICNTVARAQAIYQVLAAAALVPPADLLLFHARTPFAWRDEVEKTVLARFGKDGEQTGARPSKAIVVATQVIEQSLDLDFDLMVSDLAPIDLLVQRAGRLHRHERGHRPPHLSTPMLYVAVAVVDDLPQFGNDHYVYESYILFRTYLALSGYPTLLLPQQTSALIEAVYGEATDAITVPATLAIEFEHAQQKMIKNQDKARQEAKLRLIPKPDDEDLLSRRSPGLEEESPELHASFQALTRLGERSLSVVCLHQLPKGLNTEPDGSGTYIDLRHKPNAYTTRVLAQYTVSVSSRTIVNHLLKAGEIPATWRDHALLCDHYVLIFADGSKTLPDIKTTLRLSREYGLEILKEEQ